MRRRSWPSLRTLRVGREQVRNRTFEVVLRRERFFLPLDEAEDGVDDAESCSKRS